jgi:hypothetical protein
MKNVQHGAFTPKIKRPKGRFFCAHEMDVRVEPRVWRGAPITQIAAARAVPTGKDRLDFMPGGKSPEPYRNSWRRAGDTGLSAREPFNSPRVKGECRSTAAWLNGRDHDAREAG